VKPLLIGEAPSRTGDAFAMFPLSGRPAEVLCRAAGIPPQSEGTRYGRWTWALYERFTCVNLIKRYGQAYPWDASAARLRARALLAGRSYPVVVGLGRRVGKALEVTVGFGEWEERDGMLITTAPHPSGLSRAMNDPATRALLGGVLQDAQDRARELA
jgi:hypothetical protein